MGIIGLMGILREYGISCEEDMSGCLKIFAEDCQIPVVYCVIFRIEMVFVLVLRGCSPFSDRPISRFYFLFFFDVPHSTRKHNRKKNLVFVILPASNKT